MPSDASTVDPIIARRDQYMVHAYPRYPIAMVRGQGRTLWDSEGREYLDLFCGFGAGLLGHCHPDLVAAVTRQASELWHVGNLMHTEPQTRLAEAIATHGFGGRSFFCHSGADANEAAIKLARLHGRANPGSAGPRYKVITALQSFHGRSLATMCATGQVKVREGFDPLPEGFVNVPYNDLQAVEDAIDDLTTAVMVEPIQGEGGIIVPTDDYLPGLRKLCDRHNLLLIVDEVWTGGGRTGRYFAHQHWDVTPDVMTLAKGVGGGLPVGVMCAAPEAAELFDVEKQGGVKHATTLGGNCLSMAVGAAIFEVLERDGLVERAAALGQSVMKRLGELAAKCPAIRDVRGRGMFIGIELNADGATFKNAGEVVQRCLEQRVILGAAQQQVVRLAPALTVTEDELERGLTVLEQALRA